MGMDIVYADELFLLNVLTDYLLLLSAARLRGLPLRRGRLALGALLGGGYAVLCLLPALAPLRTLPGIAAMSLAMAAAAYGAGPGFWSSWAAFLGAAAAFAGSVMAGAMLRGLSPSSPLHLLLSLRTLLLSFGFFYALLRFLLDRQLFRRRRAVLRAEVSFRGRRAAFAVLRDTGNGLADPLSGEHVLIAEAAALSPLFPPELNAAGGAADPAGFLRSLAGREERRRFRLLPYWGVGGSGLLLCFRPDELRLDGRAQQMLVGISPTAFSEQSEFQAIV